MITSANIVSYDGYNLIVRPHERIGRELAQKQVHEIELRIVDGRTISAEQRRKIYAIIRDIAFWCGDNPEWIKECHDLGMKVNAFPIDNTDDIKWLISQGIDYITTNEPVKLQEIIREKQ